jgi:putative transposase
VLPSRRSCEGWGDEDEADFGGGGGALSLHVADLWGERLLGAREKEVLTGMLWQAAAFCGVRVLTFAVMSNHFHVLVFVPGKRVVSDAELVERYRALYGRSRAPFQPRPEVLEAILAAGGAEAAAWRERLLKRMHAVSEFMKTVKQRFTVWYNQHHGRYGTLWADRFKSVLVEAEPRALSTVAAYIDLNAVRAGLVQDPGDYRWCGYGEAMGGAERSRAGLQALFDNRHGRWSSCVADYRLLLFGQGAKKTTAAAGLDRAAVLQVIGAQGRVSRAAALRCRVRYFTDGAVLGSAAFVRGWLEGHRAPGKTKRSPDPRPLAGADWGDLTVSHTLRKAVFG